MLRIQEEDASSNDMDRVGYGYEVDRYRSVMGMYDTGTKLVPMHYSIRQLLHP